MYYFQVRYKCVKGRYNGDTVALYLLEPKTCKYVLTIESPSLCELINGPMDEYGIFDLNSDFDNKNKQSSSSAQVEHDAHTKENVQKKDTNIRVEQDTKVSGDKKKIDKIEL